MSKLDIMLNGERVDALSAIVHREKAYTWGKKLSMTSCRNGHFTFSYI